jgi:hypothetical protein
VSVPKVRAAEEETAAVNSWSAISVPGAAKDGWYIGSLDKEALQQRRCEFSTSLACRETQTSCCQIVTRMTAVSRSAALL